MKKQVTVYVELEEGGFPSSFMPVRAEHVGGRVYKLLPTENDSDLDMLYIPLNSLAHCLPVSFNATSSTTSAHLQNQLNHEVTDAFNPAGMVLVAYRLVPDPGGALQDMLEQHYADSETF